MSDYLIPTKPGFRFTPYAYQKLLYFLHIGDTEVGGFGILDEEDPSVIIDFCLVKQECTSATVDLMDLDKYVDEMVDEGISPNRSFRVWIHTHPGSSPNPSSTDWKTFNELMENYPWFAMLIIDRSHNTYGYLKLTQGPGLSKQVDISIDWNYPCQEIDFQELDNEYCEKVTEKKIKIKSSPKGKYDKGYENINWSPNDALANRWGSSNHNYLNTKEDFDLDEDDLKECYLDFIQKKSLHEMTEEEFEKFQAFADELED